MYTANDLLINDDDIWLIKGCRDSLEAKIVDLGFLPSANADFLRVLRRLLLSGHFIILLVLLT